MRNAPWGEMCAPPRDPPLPTLILLQLRCILLLQLRYLLLLPTTATYDCCILLLPTTAAYYCYLPTGPPRDPRAHFPPWCISHALLQIGLLKGL